MPDLAQELLPSKEAVMKTWELAVAFVLFFPKMDTTWFLSLHFYKGK
jgi:hypothetical protein